MDGSLEMLRAQNGKGFLLVFRQGFGRQLQVIKKGGRVHIATVNLIPNVVKIPRS